MALLFDSYCSKELSPSHGQLLAPPRYQKRERFQRECYQREGSKENVKMVLSLLLTLLILVGLFL